MAQIDLLKDRIKNEFDNNEQYEKILTQLLEDTKNLALANLYPFEDWSVLELPRKYYNWQLRACVEIKNSLGMAGLKSYSENGLSFTRDTDGVISSSLLDELMSKAGTVKAMQNGKVTLVINKDNQLWNSNDIKVSLYKSGEEAYSENIKKGANVIFNNIANGTYNIYASRSTLDVDDLIDTQQVVVIDDNEGLGHIDYFTVYNMPETGTTLTVKLENNQGEEITDKASVLADSNIYVEASLETGYKDLIVCKNDLVIDNQSETNVYRRTLIISRATPEE